MSSPTLNDAELVPQLAVASHDAARAFYRDLLGLRYVYEDGFGMTFSVGSGSLRLTKLQQPFTPHPFAVLAFRVADVDGRTLGGRRHLELADGPRERGGGAVRERPNIDGSGGRRHVAVLDALAEGKELLAESLDAVLEGLLLGSAQSQLARARELGLAGALELGLQLFDRGVVAALG